MKDVREKKCGCLIFQIGPPILCDQHQQQAHKKERRAKVSEERGLRRTVAEQARDLGHDLTPFKPYGSSPGKWTSYCRDCGSIVIVYDEIPRNGGDQVAGKACFQPCRPSAIVGLPDAADETSSVACNER